jgi:hypothetical protein
MITELDKLNRAKEYLDKLAEGLDPFTGGELAEDTVLNNVRLSRCFFYVSDVLRQVIANGGRVGRPQGPQKPFSITGEELARVNISDTPVSVSIFVKSVNDTVADTGRKRLSAVTVTNWLVKEGYLKAEETEPGKHKKVLTDRSASIGMSSETRESMRGTFEIMLYGPKAQRFLLDNMKNILGE